LLLLMVWGQQLPHLLHLLLLTVQTEVLVALLWVAACCCS
jgi:hypothetical protein